MNKIEKSLILIALIVSVVYIVAFNLNVPHYWSDEPRVISENTLKIIWYFALLFSIATIIVIIKDSGKRNIENRTSWLAYILLLSVIAIPHYYLKYGRNVRE